MGDLQQSKSGWVTAGIAAAMALVLCNPLPGQQVPQLPQGVTPEQAADMLERQPSLGQVVERQLRESGLSADEIRSRLRAFGYSGSALDSYLEPDSTGVPDPAESTLAAMRAIGVAGFSVQDSLLLAGDTVAIRMFTDSIRADSIRQAEELARLNRPFELFGLNVFRNATTRFQPITTGPVDRSYRVGPGDVLVLILSGQVERAHTLEVTGEGFVFVPQVGQVFVNNLSLDQIDAVFFDRLRQVYSGVSRGPNPATRFEVAVSRVRTIAVRVTGEVAVPGTYQISAAAGPLASIYEAGGLLETSNFRRVEVRRGAELAFTIDLYDFLTRGVIPRGESRLQSGDVVFVPSRGARVKIAGEVVRPGIYEVTPTETVADLIGFAGGLSEFAATANATLDRIVPPSSRTERGRERTVLTIDLQSTLDSTIPGVRLINGDSLTIYRIPDIVTRFVAIEGAVWQPGTYAAEPGMTLQDLIRVAGGLRPEAYTGRVQILRTRPDSTTMLIGAPLGDGLSTPSTNPTLQESDRVTVFSEASFSAARFIAVWGEVHEPGILPFSDSMTLRDAVLLAGGITDGAYLLQAEISRLSSVSEGGDSLVTILQTHLDSTYLLGQDRYRDRGRSASGAPEVTLHPYDNVFVRRQPGWETQRNVVLTGQVRFTGRYSLISRDERLLSVIERAGGLTPEAYPNGIQFFRQEGAGRIAVDLPAVLLDPQHKDNLGLVAGDSIHIPRYIPTVRVEGAVNSPSSVAYLRGRNMGYYIDAAGGYSHRADRGKRYVQQPNGLIQRDANPEPGAVVVVPAKDPNDVGINWVSLVSGVSTVLASLVTVIIVLVR